MKKFRKNIRALLVIITIIVNQNIAAQNIVSQQESIGQSLIASNSLDTINPHIMIKWFIPEIYVSKGIQIYKKVPGQEWVKINDKPFKKGDYNIPNEAFVEDTTLEDYVSFINGLSINEIQGLTKAMILIKGIQNAHYARYIGIEYHDINVKKGEQLQYKVTKLTSNGEVEIGISQLITVKKHNPDNPPDEIQILPGDGKVLLKWKPDNRKFYGINIFRRKDNQQDFEKMNEVPIIISKRKGQDGVLDYPDIFFTDDSLSNGVSYYYKIVGLDYFGRNSKFSEIVKVTPKDKKAPSSPQYLRNKVELLKVNLSWENVFSPDIAGINIYRSIHHNVDFKKINNQLLDFTLKQYDDVVEKPGKYYYYVASVDSSGNEGNSFLTLANVMDIYPPVKPKGLYTESDTGRITLHWLPNTDYDLMGYQVFRTINNDKKDRYVLLNSNPFIDTTYIDSLPLSAKNKFLYRVAAIDSAFNRSEYSDFAMNSMPDVVPPAQPFIKDVVITADRYLEVRWIPNADLDLKGYNIFRELTNDSIRKIEKLNESILNPIVKHYTDRWVENEVGYNYYLVAIDSSGNTSQYSNPFPSILPSVKPEVSDKLIKFINVKNKGNYNLIRWEIEPEIGYLGTIVYRKEEGGIYRPLTGLMQNDKHKDNDIISGGIYYYEIRVYHEKYGESRSKEEKIVIPIDEKENL